MRARTYHILFLVIILSAFTFIIIPHISHADVPSNFTGLIWTNPNTDAQTIIQDGGTYNVPFNIAGRTQIGMKNRDTSWILFSTLYHISTTSNERTFVAYIEDQSEVPFSWKKSGEYELVLNNFLPVVNIAPWWHSVFAFFIGNTTYAAAYYPHSIVNIHFTIHNANDTCAAHNSCTDNVLFIPGTEASRLYYRGTFGTEHQVWEPDFYTDIPYLAMNADGTSKYKLYTKDIIGSLYGNNPVEKSIAKLRLGSNGVQVYGNFEQFMNGLVASSTIKEWRAYPYDWRYGVRDIVNNGTLTEIPNGTIKRVYIENVLEQLASTSPTGKVTIIAHSNGGLVAKALMQKLSADGKSDLVDKLIMVSTPQWGTPEAIGVMLHGDGQTQALGLIMNGKDARAITKTIPDTYDLLPSPTYFAHVSTPVVTFDTNGSLTKKFATAFGATITSFSKLEDFLENSAGLDSQIGDVDALRTPIVLSSTLINKAAETHATLDTWTPSPAIAVTAIAGWGQDTVKTLAYTTQYKTVCNYLSASVIGALEPSCTNIAYLEHTPITTQDGDGTVVSPSAVGNVGQKLYFNIKGFDNNYTEKIIHRNITSAFPIQYIIKNILTHINPTTVQYITTSKPTSGTSPIKLRISSHSPVNLIVTGVNGKQSGVVHIPGTDFSGVKRDILGSSVQVFDSEEYINVPKSGTYHIVAKGYANGPTTLRIETISSNGVASTTETFANIPTTASSTVTFSLTNGKPTSPVIDLTGTGKNTFIMSTSTTPLAYIRYMKSAIKAMQLSRSEHFMLNARLSAIEMQLTGVNKMERMLKNINGRMHSRYQYSSKWRNQSIKFELSTLTRYIEQQFTLSARLDKYKYPHISWRWHNAQPHITATQTETILGMINKLTKLL